MAAQGWALRRTTTLERALLTLSGLLLIFPSLLEAGAEAIIGRDISYTATFGLLVGGWCIVETGFATGRAAERKSRLINGRKKKMSKRTHIAIAGLALGAALLAGTAVAQQLNIAIATGGTGGVYYPMGGGMANVLSKNLPGVNATARVTGGSVDNLKLIGSEQSEVALVMVDAALDALKGEDKFKGNPVEVRTLMVLYPNRMHVVTVDGTGINKMSDLKGKRVSTGSPGSATEVMAFRVIEAAGLDKDKDMTRERLGVAESTNALKDRKIDAYFWVGGLPTAAVTDLGATPNVKIKLIDTRRSGRQDERQIRRSLQQGRDPGEDLSGSGCRQQDRGGAEHPGHQLQDDRQGRLRHRQDAVREAGRRRARAWRGEGDRARHAEQGEHHDPVASGRREILHRDRREDVSASPRKRVLKTTAPQSKCGAVLLTDRLP